MSQLTNLVMWIYIVLIFAGGLMGFLKAKSKASLISSSIIAALLVFTVTPGILTSGTARLSSNVIMAAVLVIFASRLAKTKKFMPAGPILVMTMVALVFRNLVK